MGRPLGKRAARVPVKRVAHSAEPSSWRLTSVRLNGSGSDGSSAEPQQRRFADLAVGTGPVLLVRPGPERFGGELANTGWRAAEARRDMTSDAELIGRSLSGDAEAFMEVICRHEVAIGAYLERRVGREAAEDLLGDVWAAAFEYWRTYDQSFAGARPWLYTMALNRLRRHRREFDGRRAAHADHHGRTGAVWRRRRPGADGQRPDQDPDQLRGIGWRTADGRGNRPGLPGDAGRHRGRQVLAT
ncbi:MAG: RNA polymerase sigma factor, partial [Streptosporangiaceae bacterium]